DHRPGRRGRDRPAAGPDPDPGSHPGLCAEDHRHLRRPPAVPAADGRADGRLHAADRRPHRGDVAVALAPAVEMYGAGLVFARVGSLAMLLPGVGESAVPPRVRLAFALVLSIAIYAIVRSRLPAVPATVGG